MAAQRIASHLASLTPLPDQRPWPRYAVEAETWTAIGDALGAGGGDLLALWATQQWTVVFVTHSVYESVYLSTRIAVMTARPGRTASEVSVKAPSPRDEAFRTSPLYNEYCREVSARLAQATGP